LPGGLDLDRAARGIFGHARLHRYYQNFDQTPNFYRHSGS
jgi:hypothetical protein